MGKFEQEASKKVLAGERIIVKTRFSVLDFLLRPYRAYKQKQQEAEYRRRLLYGDKENE